MALGFYFLDAFIKSQEGQQFRFIMSVCPCAIIWLPLDRFSGNLIYEYFSKICHEDSSLFKI
jgi:hypothetical protein